MSIPAKKTRVIGSVTEVKVIVQYVKGTGVVVKVATSEYEVWEDAIQVKANLHFTTSPTRLGAVAENGE